MKSTALLTKLDYVVAVLIGGSLLASVCDDYAAYRGLFAASHKVINMFFWLIAYGIILYAAWFVGKGNKAAKKFTLVITGGALFNFISWLIKSPSPRTSFLCLSTYYQAAQMLSILVISGLVASILLQKTTESVSSEEKL